VSSDDLAAVKAKEKKKYLSAIDSNMGLALRLASAQNLQGDWREAFHWLEKIDKVSAADIQRVAKTLFVKSNRSVAVIETTSAAPAAPAAK
jgi:predicted Zn-dependent peptidase